MRPYKVLNIRELTFHVHRTEVTIATSTRFDAHSRLPTVSKCEILRL
jgi:hypothetical protein